MPTTVITVTDEQYVQVAPGACFIDRRGKQTGVRVHLGASQPAPDTEAYHAIVDANDGLSSGSAEPHWCRAESGSIDLVVTTVA